MFNDNGDNYRFAECDECGTKDVAVAQVVLPAGWENTSAWVCTDCLLRVAGQLIDWRERQLEVEGES